MNGNGGVALAAQLKTLATATPSLKLSVGDLASATDSVVKFLSTLDPQSY
jgi:hypothetical protein